MKTLRDPGDMSRASFDPRGGRRRPLLVVGALLLLAVVFAGCGVFEELTTTTTAPPQASSSASVGDTTTTQLTTTTTVARTTTTAAPENAATTTTTLRDRATTPTPRLPTTPLRPAGSVLYEIDDWSQGVSGWAAAGQWKTALGMLVTDGSSDSFAVAPVDLTGYPDYAVECEAQIIDPDAGTVVVLLARLINGTAYYGGFDSGDSRMVVGYDTSELGGAGFVLDSEWHKYRLEVRGNSIKLFLEQAEVARAVDNRVLEPGTVGIYCGDGQINVRAFRVIAL